MEALSEPRLDTGIAADSIILTMHRTGWVLVIQQLSMRLDDEFTLVDVIKRDLKF